jgi:hypothetical protein
LFRFLVFLNRSAQLAPAAASGTPLETGQDKDPQDEEAGRGQHGNEPVHMHLVFVLISPPSLYTINMLALIDLVN